MKVALLGNGTSRNIFLNSTNRYDYIIGCNIPWTVVDATVIIDINVLDKLDATCKLYVSRKAWMECPLKKRDKLIGTLIGLFDPIPDYDSTGHAAARIVLERGATEIDIYGCDSWFTNDTESYTHQFVDSRSIDMSKNVSVWRARWYELMATHPQVVFNFIGDPK